MTLEERKSSLNDQWKYLNTNLSSQYGLLYNVIFKSILYQGQKITSILLLNHRNKMLKKQLSFTQTHNLILNSSCKIKREHQLIYISSLFYVLLLNIFFLHLNFIERIDSYTIGFLLECSAICFVFKHIYLLTKPLNDVTKYGNRVIMKVCYMIERDIKNFIAQLNHSNALKQLLTYWEVAYLICKISINSIKALPPIFYEVVGKFNDPYVQQLRALNLRSSN